ncbi:MAG TPA: hypothetical protein VNL77_21215 [Roseiflexaceae bacterium]|nr:hypothetical protein [Roseiflexaceae bacterium]
MLQAPRLQPPEVVRRRYEAALESFVGKVRQDGYIIAAILCGSLSHDTVWEKSDIDIILVGRDERRPLRTYSLVEDGINIHVLLYARSRFRKEIEGALTSSFFHSYFSKSTLLFTSDDSIREYYDDAGRLGSADRELLLMRQAAWSTAVLTKAQKWLYVKEDTAYSFLWHMYLVNHLAQIETLLAGEVTGREVVQQAMKHNPAFFNRIYFDVINKPKSPALMQEILLAAEGYLLERTEVLFKPLLDYLAAAGGARTVTEIDAYFDKQLQSDHGGAALACEWLAEQGVIAKVAAPLRLTEKSQVTVDEAAYYYERG